MTNRYNYAEFKNGEKMLFDLNSDPDENVNLATSPKQKENLKRLGRILKDGWRGVLPQTYVKVVRH